VINAANSSKIAITLFKLSICMDRTKKDPNIEPELANITAGITFLSGLIPFEEKPTAPAILSVRIAIRLVALATDEGKPIHIKTGRVKIDPPPPTTFIKPASAPVKYTIRN